MAPRCFHKRWRKVCRYVWAPSRIAERLFFGHWKSYSALLTFYAHTDTHTHLARVIIIMLNKQKSLSGRKCLGKAEERLRRCTFSAIKDTLTCLPLLCCIITFHSSKISSLRNDNALLGILTKQKNIMAITLLFRIKHISFLRPNLHTCIHSTFYAHMAYP